jgi:hypothetical protein
MDSTESRAPTTPPHHESLHDLDNVPRGCWINIEGDELQGLLNSRQTDCQSRNGELFDPVPQGYSTMRTVDFKLPLSAHASTSHSTRKFMNSPTPSPRRQTGGRALPSTEQTLQEPYLTNSKTSQGILRRPASTGMLRYEEFVHGRTLVNPICEKIWQLQAPGFQDAWSEQIEGAMNDRNLSTTKYGARKVSGKTRMTTHHGDQSILESTAGAQRPSGAYLDGNVEKRRLSSMSPSPQTAWIESSPDSSNAEARMPPSKGYRKQAPIDRSKTTSPRTIVRTLAWAKKVTELARVEYGKSTLEC